MSLADLRRLVPPSRWGGPRLAKTSNRIYAALGMTLMVILHVIVLLPNRATDTAKVQQSLFLAGCFWVCYRLGIACCVIPGRTNLVIVGWYATVIVPWSAIEGFSVDQFPRVHLRSGRRITIPAFDGGLVTVALGDGRRRRLAYYLHDLLEERRRPDDKPRRVRWTVLPAFLQLVAVVGGFLASDLLLLL